MLSLNVFIDDTSPRTDKHDKTAARFVSHIQQCLAFG